MEVERRDMAAKQEAVVEQPIPIVPKSSGLKGFRYTGEVLQKLLHQIKRRPLAGSMQDRRHGGEWLAGGGHTVSAHRR